MRLLLVNSMCGIGSAGRLCMDIAKAYDHDGNEVRIAYGRSDYVPVESYPYAVRIGSDADNMIHEIGTRLTDRHGLFSRKATTEFLEWADEFDPDTLWLHNIHGYYLNYELLFDWIKSRPNMSVKWTLHDCWPITGHCTRFSYVKCTKWIARIPKGAMRDNTGCGNCPQKRNYPESWVVDYSRTGYLRKMKAFTGVPNMQIITPSVWMKNIVKESFLGNYPIQVVYNKIDTGIFKPTPSQFRSEYGLSKKAYLILGVSNEWGHRKGLDDFIELNNRLRHSAATDGFGRKIQIVLIGLSTRQIKNLPEGIIGIERYKSPRKLAEAYSAADVVLNPTYDDSYPSVIMEAEACGTPVITYDTGGCAETIHISGSKAIPQGIDNLEKEVLRRI